MSEWTFTPYPGPPRVVFWSEEWCNTCAREWGLKKDGEHGDASEAHFGSLVGWVSYVCQSSQAATLYPVTTRGWGGGTTTPRTQGCEHRNHLGHLHYYDECDDRAAMEQLFVEFTARVEEG